MKSWMMAVRVFEFTSVSVHAICLIVSLATATAINPCYELYREVAFTSQQMNFSKKVCSTQNPDQVFNRVRSNIECTVLCKGTEGCSGVNWKKPSTCEVYVMYVTRQTSFETVTSCTYFGLKDQAVYLAVYLGCYKDLPAQRDLSAASFLVGANKTSCRSFCMDSISTYFGLQDGGECYSGDNYGRYGRDSDTGCPFNCTSAPEDPCGGSDHNSVFTVCPVGAYGDRCSLACHCANDTSCLFENGTCPAGCNSGWYGPSCSNPVVPCYPIKTPRQDCPGTFPGITPSQCSQIISPGVCCFDSSEYNVPWCYLPY